VHCGAGFGEPVAEPPASRRADDGERRHLTVMFCDVVASTELAARLDPEDLREILDAYQQTVGTAIAAFGGHVATYLGDGVVVYFGYPTAYGDDPERAMRAGLAILDEVEREPILHNAGIAVRVGIHTGLTLLATGGASDRREMHAFGDTMNVAARIQSVAEPGTVVVSNATYGLVPGMFVVKELGAHRLKGVAEPLPLYHVQAASGVRSRFHAAQTRGLTPFFGRENEMFLLRSCWERVCEGEGQVVLIGGEPGIGKSRLVNRFREELNGEPHLWLESGGLPFRESTPFHAVAELLGQLLGPAGTSAEVQLEQLERSLLAAGLVPADVVPVIAPLLELPLPARYPAIEIPPEIQRRRTLAMLTAWLFGTARHQPTVAVLEDLHWVDPSTLALQDILVEQVATEPVLLVYTARPEFRPRWPLRSHHAQVMLNRLGRRDTRQMISAIARDGTLPDEVMATVAKRTHGVPLFVEELTRLVLDGGPVRDVPTTLQDSLMARLDRLGSAKEVIQVGAVIGREFTHALLHTVCGLPERELRAAVARMTDEELVYVRGIPPEATYQFKHALVQDAAYESLLRSRRHELHRKIAAVLSERFPDVAEAEPELLAHHHAAAGDVAAAVDAWQRAGERAVGRSAVAEAIEHFGRALGLVERLPDTPERTQREFALTILRAHSLQSVDGYASPDVLRAYERAQVLGRALGVMPMPLLIGLWEAVMGRGDIRTGAEYARQLFATAEASGDRAWRCWARTVQGITSFHAGDLTSACESLVAIAEFYDPSDHLRSRSDPMIMALCYRLLMAALRARADEARALAREVRAHAERLGRTFDRAWSLFYNGLLHSLLGESEAAVESGRRLRELASAEGFALFVAFAHIVEGRAHATAGALDEGTEQLERGIELLDQTGQRISLALYRSFLAATYLEGDRLDGAADALEIARGATDEPIYQPDVLRLQGRLLARRAAPAEAVEAAFREGLELARRLRAFACEIRVATDYARWLHACDRTREALAVLKPIAAVSTAADDTGDMRSAMALLAEIQGQAAAPAF
jgi:class 3 adenylate cyclase/tetratricopeptide (TPR) repeat protein